MSVHVTFASEEALRQAIGDLREAGVSETRLAVRSSTPVEDLPLSEPPQRILLWSLVGALVGGLTAYGLVYLSSTSYGLVTGDMPTISGPPSAVVTYEGIALGIILATVAGVLIEGRLGRRRLPSPLDHRVAAGDLLLIIDDRAAAGEEAESAAAEMLERFEAQRGGAVTALASVSEA